MEGEPYCPLGAHDSLGAATRLMAPFQSHQVMIRTAAPVSESRSVFDTGMCVHVIFLLTWRAGRLFSAKEYLQLNRGKEARTSLLIHGDVPFVRMHLKF